MGDGGERRRFPAVELGAALKYFGWHVTPWSLLRLCLQIPQVPQGLPLLHFDTEDVFRCAFSVTLLQGGHPHVSATQTVLPAPSSPPYSPSDG